MKDMKDNYCRNMFLILLLMKKYVMLILCRRITIIKIIGEIFSKSIIIKINSMNMNMRVKKVIKMCIKNNNAMVKLMDTAITTATVTNSSA